jgi:hypothetical protein
MKAGTTSLANLLAPHAEIYLPPIKEPNFFCTDVNAEANPEGRRNSFDAIDVKELLAAPTPRRRQIAIVRERADYLALYADAAGYRRRGDCSTAYLYSCTAAGAIAAECPDAKILVMVRDPVTRAISEYRMRRAIGSARGKLGEELAQELELLRRNLPLYHGARMYLRAGLYSEQIERYHRTFGPENVKVIVFERFVRDQQSHLDRVCDFLGIARLPAGPGERANASHVPRSAGLNRLLYWIGGKYLLTRIGSYLPVGLKRRLVGLWFQNDPDDYGAERKQLRAFFAEEVARMEKLIGGPLPEWRG